MSNVQPDLNIVLYPDGEGTWEGKCVCDPAVVHGIFSVGGNTYNHAMYYTASATCSTDNKIGVAFSNDGVNWAKYSGNPIISSANIGGGVPSYGAGQPQVRNGNGGAGIQLWYTDTMGAQGHGFYELPLGPPKS